MWTDAKFEFHTPIHPPLSLFANVACLNVFPAWDLLFFYLLNVIVFGSRQEIPWLNETLIKRTEEAMESKGFRKRLPKSERRLLCFPQTKSDLIRVRTINIFNARWKTNKVINLLSQRKLLNSSCLCHNFERRSLIKSTYHVRQSRISFRCVYFQSSLFFSCVKPCFRENVLRLIHSR